MNQPHRNQKWRKNCRRLGIMITTIIFFQVAEDFAHRQTKGFSISKIRAPIQKIHHVNRVPAPIIDILNQKFTYFDSGKQSFVFLSADGRYVLKFFKRTNLMPHWLCQIPILNRFKPFKMKKLLEDQTKQIRDYRGYAVAFAQAREETALVWIQLESTETTLPTIRLVDPIGIEHRLDLNLTHFILQKRAKTVAVCFQEWIELHQNQKIEEAIHALLCFCKQRAAKRIYDDDAAFYKNFGFLEGKVVQIDPGQYEEKSELSDPSMQKCDLQNILAEFKNWLRLEYPQLLPLVEKYENSL